MSDMIPPPLIPPRPPNTVAKVQWYLAISATGFGSLFALWFMIHLVFERSFPNLTRVELICAAGALVCPFLFAALLARRKVFLQWSNTRRIVTVVCLALLVLPSLLVTLLIILVLVLGHR